MSAGRNSRTGLIILCVVIGMLALSFAAVPFYRVFCQATGFNGTTGRAAAAPQITSQRHITVLFDAATSPELAWSFHPNQRSISVLIGQKAVAAYTAVNESTQAVTGQAVYNITPLKAGPYFKKIQCFCFSQQTLQAGEKADMPVLFFLDPALLKDPEMADVDHVTLSYTFFKAQ